MDEQRRMYKKSPVAAAVLSTLFPGVGFFYLGNYIKGIAYMLILGALITFTAHTSAPELVIFILMCVGFYIFQIFNVYDDALRQNESGVVNQPIEMPNMTLAGSWTVLVIGVIFLLGNLKLVRFGTIAKLWPLVLIGLGVKFIYMYSQNKKLTGGEDDE